MTVKMTTCEIRKAAAALLSEPGKWTQNAFERGDAYCMVGACRKVLGYYDVEPREDIDFTDIRQQARDAAQEALGASSVDDAYGFNDAPGRTAEQVVAKLLEGCE